MLFRSLIYYFNAREGDPTVTVKKERNMFFNFDEFNKREEKDTNKRNDEFLTLFIYSQFLNEF